MSTLVRIIRNPAFALLCSLFLSQNIFAVINASIDASRVSGVAPLAVFFDATATTSTATNKPFHELHYQWDFGDPSAGTWQYGNSNSKNKNKAYGPVTAHIFEIPGVYTVNLSTKGLNSDTDDESVTITVRDPNTVFSGINTICFSTKGTFSGCPTGSRHVTTSNITDIERYIAPGRRLLLHRGEIWSNGSLDIHSDGPGIIGAFGTGSKPIFDNIGFDIAAGVPPVLGEPGTRDWRVMDLEFVNMQTRCFSTQGEFENLLLLRLEAHDTAEHFIVFGGSNSVLGYYNANRGQQHEPHNGVFIVESSMVDAASYAVGNRYAVLGNSWDGGGTTHTNRYPYIGKGVISHNYYARAGNSTITLIKLHAPNWEGNAVHPPGIETREVIISDNHFDITLENWGLSLGPQSSRSSANEHVVDVIVERNLFTAENGAPQTQLQTAGYNITVRNNNFNLTGGRSVAFAASASARNSGQPPVFGFWFQNNNVFRSDSGIIRGISSSASDTEIHNNIIYSPAGNSTLGCSDGSSGCLNNLVNVDPLWTDPNNGNFSLQPGSSAIDSGRNLPVLDDFNLNSRPKNSAIDIGAYESNGGAAPPPYSPPPAPPTVNITASPSSINTGDSSTLLWDTTDADTCTAYEGWSGSIDTSGSQSVSPTTTTTYTLTCDGAGGTATTSATVSVTPQQNDTTAPSTPANLASSNTTHNSSDLSWDASSDNVDVTGYTVYKDGTLETTAAGTSITVTGLLPNTTYSFTVSAQDAVGNESNHSSSLSVTTLPDPVDGEFDGYFSNWNASDGYTIGSGLDIALTLTGDASTVKDVIFQVWSHTHGVEAAYIDESPPYIYPHTVLDDVMPGSSKYVQALLRDSGNDIIHTVSNQTTFTVEEPPVYSIVIDNRISTSSDDVEEALTSGNLYFNSSDMELGDDQTNNGTQTMGLRFQSVNIPQGVTIDTAYLEFVVDETGSSTATNVKIHAQAADNAPAFAANIKDVTNRALTSAATTWDIPAWNRVGDIKQSPDVSSVIQEVVNRAGWTANNDLVFVISGTGKRTAEAYDGVSSAAPLLHVEYSTGTTLVAPKAGFTVIMTNLAAGFTDTSSDSDGSVVNWSWDFGDGDTSTARNPDHTYAAAGTYTIALTVTDNDGATDTTNESITVEEPPVYSVTIDNRISTSRDDVEEALTSGDLYFNSSDMELGDDPTNNGTQTMGLRFQSVNIPQGATIDTAYLEFVVDETGSTATNVEIHAQAADNAPAFAANNGDITNRALTSAATTWDIPTWNTIAVKKQSPDVSAVVQEVVNRAGWTANNGLVFVISGTGKRTAEAYDGVSAAAPLLHVEYSTEVAP